MAEEEEGRMLRTVDFFTAEAVGKVLSGTEWSEKSIALVRALASAPNRALSRLEMARAVGEVNVNATNSLLGHFAKKLALALDASLVDEWKPTGGGGRDWVVFCCEGLDRWTTASPADPDGWVFVMRDSLAEGLAAAGLAANIFWSGVRDVSSGSPEPQLTCSIADPIPGQAHRPGRHAVRPGEADVDGADRLALLLVRAGDASDRQTVGGPETVAHTGRHRGGRRRRHRAVGREDIAVHPEQ